MKDQFKKKVGDLADTSSIVSNIYLGNDMSISSMKEKGTEAMHKHVKISDKLIKLGKKSFLTSHCLIKLFLLDLFLHHIVSQKDQCIYSNLIRSLNCLHFIHV